MDDIEIKVKREIRGQMIACEIYGCENEAVSEIAIGPVGYPADTFYDLCEDHDTDDKIFEMYEEDCKDNEEFFAEN